MIRSMYLTKSKVLTAWKGRSEVRLLKVQQAMCERLTVVVEMNQVESV